MTEAPCQRDVTDYETLRSEALLVGRVQGSVLLQFGLAAWLTAGRPTPLLPRQHLSRELPGLAEAPRQGALPAAVASIVFRLTQEAAHA